MKTKCFLNSLQPVDSQLLLPLMERKIWVQEGEKFLCSVVAPAASMEKLSLKVEDVIASGTTDLQPPAEASGAATITPWSWLRLKWRGKFITISGSKWISPGLLSRLEALTVGRSKVPFLHKSLRWKFFFSHRDLEKICHCVEANHPFYL